MDRRKFIRQSVMVSTGTLVGYAISGSAQEQSGVDEKRMAIIQGDLQEHVNVKAYGATGNGATDDTASIQAAINAIFSELNSRTVLYFPAGEYLVSSSFLLPINFSGLAIVGVGKRGSFVAGVNRRGSHIKFTGAGALFPVESGVELVVQDIGFSGNNKQTCFKFTQPGNGSGLSTFTRVLFEKFAVGVQFGNKYSDGGCADVGFDFCSFSSCLVGVKVLNSDGANYSFNRLYANHCPTVISSVPGSFNIKNSQLVTCGNSTSSIFDFTVAGDNSGFVLIEGLRFEQGCKKLISMSGKGRLSCLGLEEAQPSSGITLFYLKGVNATISLSRFTSGQIAAPIAILCANAGGQRSNLIFSQVYFSLAADISIYQKVVGFVNNGYVNSYKCISCTAGDSSNPIPDMGGQIHEGRVLLCGETKNSTPVELTVNGGSANKNTRIDSAREYSTGKLVILGSSSSGVARFIRQVIWNNEGIQNLQVIGTDIDAFKGCSLDITGTNNNGLVVRVTGPSAETCRWYANLAVLTSDMN